MEICTLEATAAPWSTQRPLKVGQAPPTPSASHRGDTGPWDRAELRKRPGAQWGHSQRQLQTIVEMGKRRGERSREQKFQPGETSPILSRSLSYSLHKQQAPSPALCVPSPWNLCPSRSKIGMRVRPSPLIFVFTALTILNVWFRSVKYTNVVLQQTLDLFHFAKLKLYP